MTHMDKFLYGLLEQAGFTADDNLQQLHDDLEAVFLDRMNAKIMAQIPEDKRDEAGELLHDENSDSWEVFVHKYIPEYDAFLEGVCNEFAQEYLDSMDEDDNTENNK